MRCAAMAAEAMDPGSKGSGASSTRELENLEELGAQCARSLRNLSVNRKLLCINKYFLSENTFTYVSVCYVNTVRMLFVRL